MQEVESLKKIPYSIEAEKAVLGGIFLNPDIFEDLIDIISASDFYRKGHEVIFKGMMDIYNEGLEIDPIILTSNLKKKDTFTDIGGEDILLSIISEINSSIHLLEYAKIIKEKSILRDLGEAGIKITEMAYRDDRDAEDILDNAEVIMSKVSEGKGKKDVISLGDAGIKEIERLETLFGNKGDIVGITSGFINLDKMTSGFSDSDLVIIAARPAMGKTAFALNIVLNAAKNKENSILFFSLEMSTSQLYQRFLSIESRIPLQNIRTGYIQDSDWDKLGLISSKLSNLKVNIADMPNVNVLEIRALSRKLKNKGELDMIVIDYLQLIKGFGKSSDNRQQEISDISRSLKGLARELNVPVIALSQLSRAVEARADKRPMLSDLRESGAIEQDADIVTFLYRDDYYNEESELKGVTEVIIGKQRNGPIGTARLKFFGDITRFEDYTDKVE